MTAKEANAFLLSLIAAIVAVAYILYGSIVLEILKGFIIVGWVMFVVVLFVLVYVHIYERK